MIHQLTIPEMITAILHQVVLVQVHLKVRIQDIIMILQALPNIILTEVLTMIQVEVLLELRRVVQEELLKFYFFFKNLKAFQYQIQQS